MLCGLSAATYIALQYHHVFDRLTLLTNLVMLLNLLMIKGEQLEERIWHNNKLPTGHNVNRVAAWWWRWPCKGTIMTWAGGACL